MIWYDRRMIWSFNMRLFIAVSIATFTVNCFPAFAQDKPPLRILSMVSLDLDGNGKTDHVTAVLNGAGTIPEKRDDGSYWLQDGETVDLYFYMDSDENELQLSRIPSFIKRNVLDSETTTAVSPLAVTGKASVRLDSCNGCGASISTAESLTIVSRGGELLVGGFKRNWDENVHLANAEVETTTGECDINFLTGRGFASADVTQQPKPLNHKFMPVKLADWTRKKFPKACRG